MKTQEEINKAADDAVVNKYPISGTLGLWKHGTAAQRVSAQRYNDGCIDGYKEGFKAGAALAQPEWISVDEQKPKNKQSVLTYWPGINTIIIHLYLQTSGFPKTVTHWMPLPQTPTPCT